LAAERISGTAVGSDRQQIVSAVHLILREFSQCDDEFLR
jgi:hypothetical protein